MGNGLNFTQVADILAEIVSQATGEKVLAPLDLTQFVNVGTTALQLGYDPIYRAISQVLSRTIFSIRPYYRKFQGLESSVERWGNHVRKISYVDTRPEDNDTYNYPALWDNTQAPPSGNGKSVDQWIIKKMEFLQTNFYGANVFGDHLSIFRKPLEVAFQNAAEFGYFISGMLTNWTSQREQWIENLGRATLGNLIASVYAEGNAARVVHVLSNYKDATGITLTPQTALAPDNYVPFVEWVFSEIDRISNLMTERSLMYHTIINGKSITRHTPLSEQRLYMYSPFMTQVTNMALTNIYHPNFLNRIPVEKVNYWQSIESPSSLNMKPSYIGTTGELVTPAEAVNIENVMGILCDREAIGFALTDNSALATPINARAEYSNIWWHSTFKCWNDLTENAVIFVLD